MLSPCEEEAEAAAGRRHRPLGRLPDLAASAGPMADSSPALALREDGPRAPRSLAPSPPPRSRSGSEPEEAELSLSLARTKTRSYGSTASVRAPLGAGVTERHVEHRVRAGDTLQGIALKYGVTVSRGGRLGLRWRRWLGERRKMGRREEERERLGAGHVSSGGRRGCGLPPAGWAPSAHSVCAAGYSSGRQSWFCSLGKVGAGGGGASKAPAPGGCIEFPVPCPDANQICRVTRAKEDPGLWHRREPRSPEFQSRSYH